MEGKLLINPKERLMINWTGSERLVFLSSFTLHSASPFCVCVCVCSGLVIPPKKVSLSSVDCDDSVDAVSGS